MSKENKYRVKRKIGLATFEEMENQYSSYYFHKWSPQDRIAFLHMLNKSCFAFGGIDLEKMSVKRKIRLVESPI